MCGIVGYIGKEQAAPRLLAGLRKLEYRGYDSAGIAIRGDHGFEVAKATGKLQELIDLTHDGKDLPGICGIGHTRWATHGEPTENNAHPHISYHRHVIGVHNGIIENYLEQKTKLEVRKGFKFYSDTDTEVAVNLVEYYFLKYGLGPRDAIARAMMRIRGSYALALMFDCEPNKIYLARKDSPLIIAKAKDGVYIASDVPAILQYAQDVYYIDNMEIAETDGVDVLFFTIDQEPIEKELVHVDMDPESAEKGGYEHFMIKEILEQPKAIKDTLQSILGEGKLDLAHIGLSDEELRSIDQLYITACGSAYHAGVVGQYVIEDLAGVPVRIELASELRYRSMPFARNGCLILVSQSGETADTLAALRKAKEAGVKTIAVVNVLGSSIAREADYTLYTVCGPEISVATTKAYSAQLIAMYAIAMNLGLAKGKISEEEYQRLLQELIAIPEKVESIVKKRGRFLQRFANRISTIHDAFFIGRGIDYAVGLEASLKLKEISYIHSEAYAAGELKHGTISLIEKGTFVIGILTQPDLLEKTLSNMVEVQARGATLLAIDMSGDDNVKKTANNVVCLPKTDPHFAASLSVLPLQLLAYYVSMAKGLDVDKPRNLAKSVTVE